MLKTLSSRGQRVVSLQTGQPQTWRPWSGLQAWFTTSERDRGAKEQVQMTRAPPAQCHGKGIQVHQDSSFLSWGAVALQPAPLGAHFSKAMRDDSRALLRPQDGLSAPHGRADATSSSFPEQGTSAWKTDIHQTHPQSLICDSKIPKALRTSS